MHKKALFYSLDEKITPTQLKKLDKIEIKNTNKLEKYCKENNIKALIGDEVFLKKTKNTPYILYYIGDYNLIKNKKIIGIVGARDITNFIKQKLDIFFNDIKNYNNIAIVSGLADGTDIYAHKLALKYNIPTISVLGFGIAKALAGTTRHIIKEIKDNNGLIISEFKLKQPGTTRTFPQRNRIIAGLSDILFVPQAKENSGTCITIEDALEINTAVYSCFSDIDDFHGIGTNKLISEGKIKGIYNMNIFFDEIKSKFKLSQSRQNTSKNISLELDKDEIEIYKSIQKGKGSIEDICLDTKKGIDEVVNALSMMEIKGIIKMENMEYKIV